MFQSGEGMIAMMTKRRREERLGDSSLATAVDLYAQNASSCFRQSRAKHLTYDKLVFIRAFLGLERSLLSHRPFVKQATTNPYKADLFYSGCSVPFPNLIASINLLHSINSCPSPELSFQVSFTYTRRRMLLFWSKLRRLDT